MRPLTNEEAEFVAQHLPLVDYCLRGRWHDYALFQDLRAAGYLGLCRAVQLYDPERSQFSTYAIYWIRQAIQRERQRQMMIAVPFHHHYTTKHDGHKEAERVMHAKSVQWEDDEAASVLAVTLPPESTSDRDQRIRSCLSDLSPFSRHVVQRIVMNGDRLIDVARELGMSRQRVAAMKDRALRQLRARLTELEPNRKHAGA